MVTTPPLPSDGVLPVDTHHVRPTHRDSAWKASFSDSLPANFWADRILIVEEVLDTLDDLISLRQESANATRNSNLTPVTFEALCCAWAVIRMLEQFDNSRPIDDYTKATLTEEPSVQTWDGRKHADRAIASDGNRIGANSAGDSGYASGQHGSQPRAKSPDAVMEAVSEEEHMDNETIYSFVSIQPEPQSAYVEEFSRFLADDIRLLAGPMRRTGLTFSLSATQLLKSFARRLHSEASSNAERQVSALLHQHRGYV
jgi:hypothetical protein